MGEPAETKKHYTDVPWAFVSIAIVAVGGAVAYSASTGAGLAVVQDGAQIPLVYCCALLAFVINWVAFVPAFCHQTEHYYDFTGSITYLSTIWLSFGVGAALRGSIPLRQCIVTCMVTVWAVRLGTFLFKRVKQAGKDGRFDTLKPGFWIFLMVWTLQGLWVLFTAIAAIVINCSSSTEPLGVNDLAGFAVWVLGFGIEVVSDNQKSKFNSNPDNKGKWIEEGLWYYSRHPNYFGEIVLWLGIAIVGTSVYQQGEWISFLSPVFVTFLLTQISGVPLLEKRADEKWGHVKEYLEYKARTSVLVILPKGKAPLTVR